MTVTIPSECATALKTWLSQHLTAADLETVVPMNDPLRMWWKPQNADLLIDQLLEVLTGGDDFLTLLALIHSVSAKPGGELPPLGVEKWLAEQLAARSRWSRQSASDTGFDAFLSYCHRDRERVDVLLSFLRGAGLRIFFDAEQIVPGDNIVARLHAGMTSTRQAIIAVTAYYIESPWARRELEALIEQSRHQELRFLPVLLDAVPLPAVIADIQTIDLRGFSVTQERSWAISRLKPLIAICNRKD